MRITRVVTAMALTAAAGVASAGPTDLGTGPGTYNFTLNHDKSYFVTLGPGTYDISGSVVADGFDLNTVWLSHGKDNNPFSPNGKNDFELFAENSPNNWSTNYQLTLTKATDIYVDVDTHWGKGTNGAYNGVLTVSAVPEPASYALLLAGVGLLGFMGMRRRRG